MPEKHVPKHRAPRRELFGRRNSVNQQSNNGNGSWDDESERVSASVSLAKAAALDENAQRTATEPKASAAPALPAGAVSNNSKELFAPDAPPVLSSEDYFDSLAAPKAASPPPEAPGQEKAPADPAEILSSPALAPSQRPKDEADLPDVLDRIQVKSAITGGGQAWDPFLKDPEPDSGRPRLRRREPISDMDRLKTKKKRIRPVRPVTVEEHGHQHQTFGQWLKEILLLGLIAVLTAVLLTNYVVQAFFIPSESMEDTLIINDRVLVNKLVYKFRDPRPGDIVVFTSPEMAQADIPETGPIGQVLNEAAQGLGLRSSVQDLIKRVIAVEGQTVEVKIGSVFVDGKQVGEPYRKDSLPMPNYGPFKVPAGQVFVMGDNRSESRDSRAFGAVNADTIVGRAFARIWPLQRFTLLTS